MALRFSKRIKIAPGIRLNISGSGVSTTFGGRGLSVNTGRRGTHANVGLPGTGLGSRHKLSAASSQRAPKSATKVSEVRLVADEEGNCYLLDSNDRRLSESETTAVRKTHGDYLKGSLHIACEGRNQLLTAVTSVHLDTPAPSTAPTYEQQPFLCEKPTQTFIQKTFSLLSKSHKNKHLLAVDNWTAEKAAWEALEQYREEEETRLIFTSIEAIDNTLARYLSDIDWPTPPTVSYDLGDNIHTIAVDIQLPEEQDIPTVKWSVPARQYRLSAKKLTATKQRQLYRDYIHGIIFRVAGEIFARLPTVDRAAISAYRNTSNPATGNAAEQYVVSVIISRVDWERINFSTIEQVQTPEALDMFSLRQKMTSTGIFKEVIPFTAEELEEA